MNASTRCTHKHPRSIGRLTADLDAIAVDLYRIVVAIEEQQSRQVSPLATVPRFRGEDIRRLASAMSDVIACGERLESIAKERAHFRAMFPAQRRDWMADHHGHADQPTGSTVSSVAPWMFPPNTPAQRYESTSATH